MLFFLLYCTLRLRLHFALWGMFSHITECYTIAGISTKITPPVKYTSNHGYQIFICNEYSSSTDYMITLKSGSANAVFVFVITWRNDIHVEEMCTPYGNYGDVLMESFFYFHWHGTTYRCTVFSFFLIPQVSASPSPPFSASFSPLTALVVPVISSVPLLKLKVKMRAHFTANLRRTCHRLTRRTLFPPPPPLFFNFYLKQN